MSELVPRAYAYGFLTSVLWETLPSISSEDFSNRKLLTPALSLNMLGISADIGEFPEDMLSVYNNRE